MTTARAAASSHGLVWDGGPEDVPTVTVACNSKWYGLHVVHPDGSVDTVPFPEFTNLSTLAYVDHEPNPDAVSEWAVAQGYRVDSIAMELIIGRWEVEVLGNYSEAAGT